MLMQVTEQPTIIGRIGGPYGVRGWLKIESYTRPIENIFTYLPWLMKVGTNWQQVEIEEYQQRDSGRLLIKIAGIDTPEDAREFNRCDLAVSAEQLPTLTEGEYYWRDLIGLEVRNQEGINLGEIAHIIETGANDVMVIKNLAENGTKTLIPLIMDVFVKQVDLTANTMLVEWQLED